MIFSIFCFLSIIDPASLYHLVLHHSHPHTTPLLSSHSPYPNRLSPTTPPVNSLSELIGVDVQYVDEVIGDKAGAAASSLSPGGVLLLENVRFNKGETKNVPAFAEV